MMGVSEYKVNFNICDVLEKGLFLVGFFCFGCIDFENVI